MNSRKFFFKVVLCALPLYSSATLAENDEVFIGANIGYHLANDDSIGDSPTSGTYGIYAGKMLGHHFGIDAGYYLIDSMEFNQIKIDTSVYEAALRYVYPFEQSNIDLYGRLGVARWDMDKDTTIGSVSADGFSPLFEAGLHYHFSPSFSATAGYKYISSVGEQGLTGTYDSNSFLLGVEYSFGSSGSSEKASNIAEPEPNEVTKAAELAQTEASSALSPLSESIYFDLSSVRASKVEQDKLLEKITTIVDGINQYPDSHVLVTGYSDSSGPAKLNQKISEQRAEFVKRLLVEHGVDKERITYKGEGETFAKIPSDPTDRKVEVTLCEDCHE